MKNNNCRNYSYSGKFFPLQMSDLSIYSEVGKRMYLLINKMLCIFQVAELELVAMV